LEKNHENVDFASMTRQIEILLTPRSKLSKAKESNSQQHSILHIMVKEKAPLAVSTNVSRPEKHGSGRYAVVDYLVTTSFGNDFDNTSKDAATKGNESVVRRTFEDFQWLQERLVKERMGM